MSQIPSEVIQKLSNLQGAIWQTTSATVSEAAGNPLTFGNALTSVEPVAELYSELAAPKLVIQFSFAHLPENSQVLLLSQEDFASLASFTKGEKVTELDDNLVADVRPTVEAIVQGICIGAGNILGTPTVASGLTTRFQIFGFPPNMERSLELVRTNVAMSGDGLNITLIWLMDTETAHSLSGIAMSDESEGQEAESSPTLSIHEGKHAFDDDSSLDILMDIPLEISVELGRVKMLVRDVVDLGSGSIVEIDKAAGEPVDVLVNGRLVARGEVVVIEDNFGVRITEILSPQERLNRLNEVA